MAKDYYKILGVEKGVDDKALKKAYRKLAMQYHPDRNKDDKQAEEKFKQISEAYAVLSDSEKRKQYDSFGAEGFERQYSSDDIFRGADLGDILREFGIGGDAFGRMFGGGRTGRRTYAYRTGGSPGFDSGQDFSGFQNARQQEVKGQSLSYEMTVTLQDVMEGSQKTIALHGEDGNYEKITVKIPVGITTGQQLRLSGKGNPSPTGGPAGDLLIKVNVAPHPVFERDGDNLVMEREISFSQAVLGTTLEVKNLEGKIFNLKVPPGTNGQTKLKLKGQGLPKFKGRSRGDLLVRFNVAVPRKLTENQTKLVEQLAAEGL